jgi:thiamine biosynthesis lipoprotein
MEKIYKHLLIILFLQIFFCPGVSADSHKLITETRPLLHTFVEIKAYGKKARDAIEEAFSEMERVNVLLNNYDPDSEVSEINRHAGRNPVQVSPETMEALQLAVKYGDISGGAFDITIGPLLKLWGFAQDNPGLKGKGPDGDAVRKAKFLVDYHALELTMVKKGNRTLRTAQLKKSGMWIDVGAFTKGYVADRAVAVLKRRGIKNALISAGGTICAIGTKQDSSPWKVGIRHPRKEDSFLTIISLTDRTVSTSGDYEKFYKKNDRRRTHIIDPRTGMPVEKVQAVTVIARKGFESDALSTALFILGPDEGIKLVNSLADVEALIVSHEGRIVLSKEWPQKTVIY